MQEIRDDGTSEFTSSPLLDEFFAAANNPKNRTVALHRPGTIIEQPSGWRYVVQDDGSWRRLKDGADPE